MTNTYSAFDYDYDYYYSPDYCDYYNGDYCDYYADYERKYFSTSSDHSIVKQKSVNVEISFLYAEVSDHRSLESDKNV